VNLFHALMVAAGGGMGALSRYWIAGVVSEWLDTRYPVGTAAVNLAGSMLIGVCYVCFFEREAMNDTARHLMMVGFLGGFTTFSTFSLDTVALLETGHFALALAYVLFTVLTCLAGTALAIYITRLF